MWKIQSQNYRQCSLLLKMNKNSLKSSIFVLEITFLGMFKWLVCEARLVAPFSDTFMVSKSCHDQF